MKNKNKYLPQLLTVGILWSALSLMCWFKPPQEFSDSERRQLAKLPDITAEALGSGEFMSDFETYTLDQFPFRDSFRTVKSYSAFYFMRQKDNNGIYLSDGYASKLEYPLNEKSVINVGEKFNYIYEKYLRETDVNIYLSLIPDKNYFLAEKNGYPAMDYSRLEDILKEKTSFAKYIPIMDLLKTTDYYKTDTHWRQEYITDIADKIVAEMGAESFDIETLTKNKTDVPFYGVYYGQSALPLKSETIYYLTNSTIDSCTVYNVETEKATGIYDFEKLNSRDPYEMFLSGASPLLYINNPNAKTNRELIIFRDSFASSLTPLLLKSYSKITLIDTRYIAANYIGEYVDFNNQDVLFLYSSLILNSSSILK